MIMNELPQIRNPKVMRVSCPLLIENSKKILDRGTMILPVNKKGFSSLPLMNSPRGKANNMTPMKRNELKRAILPSSYPIFLRKILRTRIKEALIM